MLSGPRRNKMLGGSPMQKGQAGGRDASPAGPNEFSWTPPQQPQPPARRPPRMRDRVPPRRPTGPKVLTPEERQRQEREEPPKPYPGLITEPFPAAAAKGGDGNSTVDPGRWLPWPLGKAGRPENPHPGAPPPSDNYGGIAPTAARIIGGLLLAAERRDRRLAAGSALDLAELLTRPKQ